MTTELDDPTAGDDQISTALHSLAERWSDSGRTPPGLFAARARQAWRRKVATVAASATLAVTGVVAVGFAVGPSLHAAVRPVTIGASSPPATPPAYTGYTASPLGVVTQPRDASFTVDTGQSQPDFVPVVDAAGLVGRVDNSGTVPGSTETSVIDLDTYSGGGPTDGGFGVIIAGLKFEGDLSGRGAGKPLVLTYSPESGPLAVGQVLYSAQDGAGTKVAGRIPVGTVTKLLPSIYPDKHEQRAEVAPFADLAHPGQVWALRKAGDDPTPKSAVTSSPPPTPGDKHLSPTQELLTAGGFTLSDYASLDPATGKPLTCLLLGTPQTNGFETDCRSTTKLGRYSLSDDLGGVAYAASGSQPAEPTVAVGRAGTSVARVVALLDDGTRVDAHVVAGGAAYAGKYFIASWSGSVPADAYVAYDAKGNQVGTETTTYGAGGHH